MNKSKLKEFKEMLAMREDYQDTKEWYIGFIRKVASMDGNWEEDDPETTHDVCMDIEACAAILVDMLDEEC